MAAVVVLGNLSDMLADVDAADYNAVRSAVQSAQTVRDAVETVGILGQHTDPVVIEARAVLEAIPAAVNAAILAALGSAFERGVPVALEWVQVDSGTIEVRLSEEPHRDGVRVRIAFVSPDGRTFV